MNLSALESRDRGIEITTLLLTHDKTAFLYKTITCQGRSQSSGIGNAPSHAPSTAATQLMKQPHSTVAFRLGN